MGTVQGILADGFTRSGEWRLADGAPDFDLEQLAMRSSVLYAYVGGGKVRYIGMSTQKLCCRMCKYHTKLRSNNRWRKVHHGLHKEIVENERCVLIYARLCAPDKLKCEERRLIDKYDPDWNDQ